MRKPKTKHQGQLGVFPRYAKLLAGIARSANDLVVMAPSQPTLPPPPTPTLQGKPETISKDIIYLDTGTDKANGDDDKPNLNKDADDDDGDTRDEGG